MRENYDSALKRVLAHEGGYVNHPEDPGGATNQGVTQRVYDAYRSRQNLPQRSVKLISPAEVATIYRTQYADKVRFNDLPLGVDYVVFDGAVNSGPAQSVKWLQRAVGVEADGVIGNVTLHAVADFPDHDLLIELMCERRMAFLRSLRTWKTFGRGWTSRVQQVGDAGQDWASGSVPRDADLVYVPGMQAKADVSQAAMPAALVGGPTTGAAGGTAAVVINEVRTQLADLAGIPTVDRILLGLTVAAVAVALGGLAWGLYARWKRRKVADALDLEVSP